MTLTSIVVFTAFAILFRLLARPAWRGWLLFVASVLAGYWLQPSTPVRYLDFWFPTLTLALAVLGWVLTRPAGAPGTARAPAKPPAVSTAQAVKAPEVLPSAWQANLPAAGILAGIVLLVGLSRYLDVSSLIIPSRPPAFEQILAAIVAAVVLALAISSVKKISSGVLWGAIAMLVALLVVLKAPPLAAAASVGLRNLMNQSTALAAAGDLRWLGFSYVAFRIIHTLRERQNQRLPELSLQEYMVYAVFFPAFTAGPIDRSDRFVKDLRKLTAEYTENAEKKIEKGKGANSDAAGLAEQKPENIKRPSAPSAYPTPWRAGPGSAVDLVARAVLPQVWPEWAAGAQRLTLGLLKKFVVADGLALVALNATNAAQLSGAGWTWVLLYSYSLQIYFDFSGYTDIAIGLGRLLGISLPENFNAPYLKTNLTLCWNSWHMTLTNWFRAYYFNPVTRWLRTIKFSSIFSPRSGEKMEENSVGIPAAVIIFFTQLSTFVLIGLWHGITWNFVLWGAWHGIGLYVQNRWSEAMRPRYTALEDRAATSAGARRLQQGLGVVSTLLTFHYVALGWVFFALPDPGLSLRVLGKLFGIGA